MSANAFVSPDIIRAQFSRAMSAMYRQEVPLYGELMELVIDVNAEVLQASRIPGVTQHESLESISEERHGAIRLGTAHELSTMRRLFAVMGMFPVDYYDLTTAGIPVHSTAFRPIDPTSLKLNPFRVFTSLLCLELIEDEVLRARATDILASRTIFTDQVLALINQYEQDGGLGEIDAASFVTEALETFRWHEQALVDQPTYEQLLESHGLTADIVCFKGPHINHLTPRTLDIDAAQVGMHESDMPNKAIIEGPPSRKHPILLRQTSFKALQEAVLFQSGNEAEAGHHTARFGEIEQRGMALTPKGRALYDQLLAQANAQTPNVEADPAHYDETLQQVFVAFPDDLDTLRRENLAYFHYQLSPKLPNTAKELLQTMLGQNPEFTKNLARGESSSELDGLIALDLLEATPITYEDFLPISAAGIFQSNLGDDAAQSFTQTANKEAFEQALGAKVINSFDEYLALQQNSLKALCLE